MSKIKVYNLRCLDRKNPKGIDQTPVFSWKLASAEQNVFQMAYQICVTAEDVVVWDSGIVKREENCGIRYQGQPLENGTTYQWSVKVWDTMDEESEIEKASFSTAMIAKNIWKASWIGSTISKKELTDITNFGAIMSGSVGAIEEQEERLDPPVYFRKVFSVNKPVKKAVLYATALGNYVLRMDGEKISNLLAPEYTSYKNHLEYQMYDVTQLVQKAKDHALGVILSDGWYSGKIGLMGIGHQYGVDNALLFQLEVEYTDGSVDSIVSDESVRFSLGGYAYADLFVGEYLDQTKIPTGYDLVEFDDANWNPVSVKNLGYDFLKAQSIDPVRIIKTIKPTLICTPKGEMVLDAGENICGYTRFATSTPVGTMIGLEHSEVLDHEGNFLQNIMGQNKNQKDKIITNAAYTVYEPELTFHGFRYVKVTGLDAVHPEDFTICVLASELDHTGSFCCSDEMLTTLQENIFRSQSGNMVCIPTDCPQRERAGWTGDMAAYAPTATFNMDVKAFLKRWLYDLRLEQLADGQVPHVVPEIPSNVYVNGQPGETHISSCGWADACILVPYALYKAYGDKTVLEENYETMRNWMSYVEQKAGEDYLGWGKLFHFGDWLIPSIMATAGNPIVTALQTKEEIALAYLAYVSGVLSEIADLLGKAVDADKYAAMQKKSREIFAKTFVDEKGQMHQPLQGLYVTAIANGMMNQEQEKGALEILVDLIHQSGDCLDTGFLSIPFLLDTLWEKGQKELACTLLFQKKAPSWLYAVTQGATTIWENWAAILPNGIRTNSSYNHFAFGCVGDFIYRRIGGLQMEKAGYKKVRICPDLQSPLTWTKTEYESVYGKIQIHWEKKETGNRLQVTLPPNTTGVVIWNGKETEIGNGTYIFE